jgi:hypothetical protein
MAQDVAFFFKQSSAARPEQDQALRCPDGVLREFRELPAVHDAVERAREAAETQLVTDGGHDPAGDEVAQVDAEFDWRHGLMRCLLCDAKREFIVGTNPTRAGEITTTTCTDCGFESTHVCEQVFVPSEDLDTLGMDLDPMDPLPPTQPMQQRSFSSDTRGAMHPTIYHLRILVLVTIVLAATTLLAEVITV